MERVEEKLQFLTQYRHILGNTSMLLWAAGHVGDEAYCVVCTRRLLYSAEEFKYCS